MKIYFYDGETGIYQGEGFADEGFFRGDATVVPEHATEIAPPPYDRGEVPVFDAAAHLWMLRCMPVTAVTG